MSATIDMGVLQELLDLCDDGDTSLVTELIDMFITDAPTRVDEVESGFQAGDLETVERAAHSLKGSSGNLGATLVMDIAESLQNASRTGDAEVVRGLVPELRSQFDSAIAELRQLRDHYSA